MVTVPTLDLRTATPAALVSALQSTSCVFLTGHGLSASDRRAWLQTASQFYALPESRKAEVAWPGEGPWKGWQPVYAGGPNALLLERFEVSLSPGGRSAGLDSWADTFDLWPAEPVVMRSAWARVYDQLHGLASRLTSMIAAGLELPEDDLPAWTTNQHSNLVVNHYLAQEEAPQPGRVRQREHTDIGGITLLWADQSPGGLEAQIGAGGSWVPVAFDDEDALLLQAGDLLHLWSRGTIPANNHRVVNPPRIDGVPQTARYSAVFFHHPDLSTWVAPALPAVADAGPEPRGIAAIDHILARQQLSARLDAGAGR